MKQILINENNLTEADLEGSVIRVKGLIINSKNELLFAHNNGTYQLIGGHREDNEAMEDTLSREIKEETGMDILIDVGPFMQVVTYDANYFGSGKKICNKIYYYIIHTDAKLNLAATKYDEIERESEFNLFYVNMNNVVDFLNETMAEGTLDSNIGKEMLLVMEEYNRMYN